MMKKTTLFAALAASSILPFAAIAEGGLSYYFEGAKMHVRATSALAGKGLVLLWDDTDKGETAAAWAHSTNFVAAVPAAGGTYTLDLDALGIGNGTPCRIASATCFERLTMLLMADRGKYIDTGIQGKNVYGVPWASIQQSVVRQVRQTPTSPSTAARVVTRVGMRAKAAFTSVSDRTLM